MECSWRLWKFLVNWVHYNLAKCDDNKINLTCKVQKYEIVFFFCKFGGGVTFLAIRLSSLKCAKSININ